jgi:hypothetical protein
MVAIGMDLMTGVLRHAASYQPEYKTNMSDFIEKNTNDDGVDRREFLKCIRFRTRYDRRLSKSIDR